MKNKKKIILKTDIYGAFAAVYDSLMENVDYNMWLSFLLKIFKRYKTNPQMILDLGCGTGTLSIKLAQRGYEVIAVDRSREMLSIAAEKAKRKKIDILFLNQSMERLELYGTVDCIISFFDCINYILTKDKLLDVFKLSENYLNIGGLFVFDMNTHFKFKNILGTNIFAEDNDDCTYIWNNCYYDKTKINEYCLTLFIKNKDGLYDKAKEFHYQRAYRNHTIITLLKQAGFEILGVFGDYTFNKPKKNTERIFFICRKKATP